ncbi:MAG: hypothetical protein K8L97_11975 [Anaerolineae bacterium]|nr:hypothetical protein [Anaerolineae bacterium]
MKKLPLLFGLLVLIATGLVYQPRIASAQESIDSPIYEEQVAPYLPDLANLSPAQAAFTLVNQIMTGDDVAAYAAGVELLRLSAVPIVSPDGAVIALPDHLALEDAALYYDLVGELVTNTRNGDFYIPEQVTELIAALELLVEVIPPEALVGGLGVWGKGADSPVEAQFAGGAVRALSATRQQVLYSGADMASLKIDPLQTILILAHLTETSQVIQPNPKAPDGHSRIYAQGDDSCVALKKVLEGVPFQSEGANPGDAVNAGDKHGVIEGLRGELINAATGTLGEEAGGRVSTVIDRGTKGLNMLLLLMGAQLDLTADKTITHFKHAAGSRAEHVKLTATAWFNSTLAQKVLTCYELAGLSVPPNGPLEGFKVRWSIDQPATGRIQEGGNFVTTISADSNKIASCGTCGEVTGSNGISTLELYPRTERNPGVGEELFGKVHVYASLDKADFPFKLADFLSFKDGVAGAGAFAATKLYDLLVNAMTRAGLPTKSLSIRVEYHGYEIYNVQGEGKVWLFYIELPVKVDLYTCTGLEGPWIGEAGMPQWDVTMFGDLAAMIAEQPLPHDFQAMNTSVNFTIPVGAGEGIYPFTINEFMSGELEIDDDYVSGDNRGFVGKIGESDVLIGGNSLQPLCDMLAGMCTVNYPIIGVRQDARCGDENEYYFDSM